MVRWNVAIHNVDEIKKDLIQLSPTFFATKWLFDTVPYVFESDYLGYVQWRHELAESIEVDPSDIIITGSAGLGISLNPYKNFKKFDEKSDIDICIFSEYYFTIAWHDLLESILPNLTPKMATAVKNHRTNYIYWETIATDQILPILSFGGKWGRIISQMNKYSCLENHEIHFRIYKNRQAFRRYLLNGLIDRQAKLLEEKK